MVLITALYLYLSLSLNQKHWATQSLYSNLLLTIGLFAVITLLTFVRPVSHAISTFFSIAHRRIKTVFSKIPAFLSYIVWSIVFGLILYSLRIGNHLFGDALQLISGTIEGKLVSPTAIGYSLLVKDLALLFSISSASNSALLLASVSILCGIVFTIFLYKILREILPESDYQLPFFLAACSCGVILLFAGYIETYALLTAWLAVFIYIGLRYLKNAVKAWLLILAFVAGCFWHVWFIAFLPALLYLLLQKNSSKSKSILIVFTVIYIIAIYVGGRIITRSKIPPVLPLWPTAESGGYTVFSLSHLLDFLNEIIMSGPSLPLIGIVLIFIYAIRKSDIIGSFLIWMTLPALAIAFIIDPVLGAMRDWDLLSLFALPAILSALYLFKRLTESGIRLQYIVIPILLLNLWHIAGFIKINHDKFESVDHTLAILRDDPHYQTEYHGGMRNIPLFFILESQYNDVDAGLEFALRRLESPDADYNDLLYIAQIYHDKKDFKTALEYFERVPPDIIADPYMMYAYGNTLAYMEKYKEAEQLLRWANRDTTMAPLYYSMGYVHLNLGNTEKAVSYLDSSILVAKDSIALMDLTIGSLTLQKRYMLAADFQKRLIKTYPDSANLVSQLGMFYVDAQEIDSARKYFTQMLVFSSDTTKIHLSSAETFYQEGYYQDALDFYRLACKYNPDKPAIVFGLGKSFHRLGDYDSAIFYLKKTVELAPNDFRPTARLAQVYYEINELDSALVTIDRLQSIHSDDSDILLRKAIILSKMGRDREALTVLRRLSQIQPDNQQAIYLTGISRYNIGDLQVAISIYNRLLKMNPGYTPVYLSLAIAFDKVGNNMEALRTLREWRKLNPSAVSDPETKTLLDKYGLPSDSMKTD